MDDALEPIATCEGCLKKICVGEMYAPSGDVDLCAQCAPMLSDAIKEYSEVVKSGELGSYADWFDSIEEMAGRLAEFEAEMAATGDRKMVIQA